jgi:NAD-dependent dihydropyrimidine dehydrogenase PreA subunit
LLPGSLKRAVHVSAPSGALMAQALVDIFSGINQKIPRAIHLIDGIMAMEGAGPSQGQARAAGWLLASTDPVALDAAAAVVMGFDPAKVPLIALSAESKLGTADCLNIDLEGAAWEELRVPDFKHPLTRAREWIEGLVPASWIGGILNRLQEAKPKIHPESCQRCGLCVQACPAQALYLSEHGLHFDRRLCIECYCCLEHCPHEALTVQRGLMNRLRDRN